MSLPKLNFLNIFITLLVISGSLFVYKQFNPPLPNWITATVEKGNVTELVSVSGFVEAKQVADLAFPSTGIVTDVFVVEGSVVKAGEVLATLANTELVAERNEAMAALAIARAAYRETAAGPRSETIAVADTNIKNAEANLARVTVEENHKVENARTALFSTNLTSQAQDPNEESTPPVVTGNYICGKEGVYNLHVYRSSSESGYSYNYTGLENGTGLVSVDQPTPIGNCGLYLKFIAGDLYSDSDWEIKIPNTRSASYTTLNNTYTLAITQAKNAVASAENSLNLARKEAGLSTAPARSEEITKANAAIAQAEARVATIDARIADRSIVAPFSGVVTDISITKGETAPTVAVITVLAENTFTLKARIPEIDITKIATTQTVRAVFDAQSQDTLTGKIIYIAPVATQIDGVAYFETIIELDQAPTWLRAGLNADIDIIIKSKDNVLRIPKRFVTTLTDGSQVVRKLDGGETATSSVEVLFSGNDGFMEVAGLSEGDVIVTP